MSLPKVTDEAIKLLRNKGATSLASTLEEAATSGNQISPDTVAQMLSVLAHNRSIPQHEEPENEELYATLNAVCPTQTRIARLMLQERCAQCCKCHISEEYALLCGVHAIVSEDPSSAGQEAFVAANDYLSIDPYWAEIGVIPLPSGGSLSGELESYALQFGMAYQQEAHQKTRMSNKSAAGAVSWEITN